MNVPDGSHLFRQLMGVSRNFIRANWLVRRARW